MDAMLAHAPRARLSPSAPPSRPPGACQPKETMDRTTAQSLISLNNRFYQAVAASFSATRSAPWQGWERVARIAREHLGLDAIEGVPVPSQTAAGPRPDPRDALTVLDVACGNMRLAPYLRSTFPQTVISYQGVDACEDLATARGLDATVPEPRSSFTKVDILDVLMHDEDPLPDASFDLVCCFGFMHHVPSFSLRRRLLETLVDHSRPNGLVAISFWQFMDDERLARKAASALERAASEPPYPGFLPSALEPGDHLLGWQDEDVFRYCHHASEAEIDELAAAAEHAGTHEVCRFSADGRTGALNRYLILEKR